PEKRPCLASRSGTVEGHSHSRRSAQACRRRWPATGSGKKHPVQNDPPRPFEAALNVDYFRQGLQPQISYQVRRQVKQSPFPICLAHSMVEVTNSSYTKPCLRASTTTTSSRRPVGQLFLVQ